MVSLGRLVSSEAPPSILRVTKITLLITKCATQVAGNGGPSAKVAVVSPADLQVNLIMANEITPHLTAEEYMDKGEYENELKQVIGDTKVTRTRRDMQSGSLQIPCN